MITEIDKNKITTTIKGQGCTSNASVSTLISEYLESKSIRNSSGHPYSLNYIRDVLNGKENLQLEKHIYDAVSFYKKRNAREVARRKLILKPAS